MTEFDRFDGRLTAALVHDADASFDDFIDVDPASIASAVVSRDPARPGWLRGGIKQVGRLGLAMAAGIAIVILVAGAILLRQSSTSVGAPTVRPSPNPTPAQSRTTPLYPAGVWTPGPSMSVARDGGHTVTTLLDGRILVSGGDDASTSAELFDPATATWSPTGSKLMRQLWATATRLVDGRVLVVGGFDSREAFAPTLASAEVYDPLTGTWTTTGTLAVPRAGHSATLLPDGRVLVAGSTGPTGRADDSLASTEVFDPATGSWTPGAPMFEARSGHTATLLPDGMVLVAGGSLVDAELFDPTTGSWMKAAASPEGFYGAAGTQLADGRLLLAGGDAPSGPGARGWPHAALYDPASDTWSKAPDMTRGRLGHAAVQLRDGRVLVSGGMAYGGPSAEHFADTEIYDPQAGTWTAGPDMLQPRASHGAVLLPDGSVLVIGGWVGADGATESTELFDPLATP